MRFNLTVFVVPWKMLKGPRYAAEGHRLVVLYPECLQPEASWRLDFKTIYNCIIRFLRMDFKSECKIHLCYCIWRPFYTLSSASCALNCAHHMSARMGFSTSGITIDAWEVLNLGGILVFNFWIRHTQSTLAFTIVAMLFIKRMMLLAKP